MTAPGRWAWASAVALVAVAVMGLAGGGLWVADASPGGQGPEEGEALFREKCAACHTLGGGVLVGPDLSGVTARRDRDWLARWIREPDRMLEEEDPLARQLLQEYGNVPMPNLGLTEAEVASIIAYLESPAAAGGEGPPAQPPAPELPAGNSVLGKDLFTGATRFQNGGPACMACHSIAGIGALGGGALGPDLTPAFGKLGEAAVGWPETVPPMAPIYSDRPLTSQEKGHLMAFLQAAAVSQRDPDRIGQLAAMGVGGALVVVLLAHLVWRRRLTAVRGPMVSGPSAGK